jgi:hypothetical protein
MYEPNYTTSQAKNIYYYSLHSKFYLKTHVTRIFVLDSLFWSYVFDHCKSYKGIFDVIVVMVLNVVLENSFNSLRINNL